jgi:excisionase family DNA binding protein
VSKQSNLPRASLTAVCARPAKETSKVTTTHIGSHARLTITQLCEELEVSRSTFYEWRTKGVAPKCIKLPNGEIRVRRDELERWLTSLEEAA